MLLFQREIRVSKNKNKNIKNPGETPNFHVNFEFDWKHLIRLKIDAET